MVVNKIFSESRKGQICHQTEHKFFKIVFGKKTLAGSQNATKQPYNFQSAVCSNTIAIGANYRFWPVVLLNNL